MESDGVRLRGCTGNVVDSGIGRFVVPSCCRRDTDNETTKAATPWSWTHAHPLGART